MCFFILAVGSTSSKQKVAFNFNKFTRIEKEKSKEIKFTFYKNDYYKSFNTEEERDFYFDYIAIKLEDIKLLFNKNKKTKYIRLIQDKIINISQIIAIKLNSDIIEFELDRDSFYLRFNTKEEVESYFYSVMKKIGAIELKNEA